MDPAEKKRDVPGTNFGIPNPEVYELSTSPSTSEVYELPTSPSTSELNELPTSPSALLQTKEIEIGYMILKDILSHPSSKYFYEMPDATLFGYHNYYNVVENPICLKEISKKFHDGDFTRLRSVVDDLKQVISNGLQFWEGDLQMMREVSQIEKVLNQNLDKLPKRLKEIYSLDDTLNELNAQKIAEALEKEEIMKWKEEILMGEQELARGQKIRNNADLPEIGLFLRKAQVPLGLKPIPQFEIERMLFLVKESTTLDSIMTTLLCPEAKRPTLFSKPIMTYEVWHVLLYKKVKKWYLEYRRNKNYNEMFQKYGIDIHFWNVFGQKNPLLCYKFDELTFEKKTCVLKALCNTVFHSSNEYHHSDLLKDILKITPVHENSKFKLIGLFSPEIRIYRYKQDTPRRNQSKKKPNFKTENSNDPEIHTKEDAQSSPIAKKNSNRIVSRRQGFFLIANDKGSLFTFIAGVKIKSSCVNSFQLLIENDQTDFIAFRSLKSMYGQWANLRSRPTDIIMESMFAWGEEMRVEDDVENAVSTLRQKNESAKSAKTPLKTSILVKTRPQKRKNTEAEIPRICSVNVDATKQLELSDGRIVVGKTIGILPSTCGTEPKPSKVFRLMNNKTPQKKDSAKVCQDSEPIRNHAKECQDSKPIGNQATECQDSEPIFQATECQDSEPIFQASECQDSEPIFQATECQDSEPIFQATECQDSEPIRNQAKESQDSEPIRNQETECQDSEPIRNHAKECQDSEPIFQATDCQDSEPIFQATECQDSEPIRNHAKECQDSEPIGNQATECQDSEPIFQATECQDSEPIFQAKEYQDSQPIRNQATDCQDSQPIRNHAKKISEQDHQKFDGSVHKMKEEAPVPYDELENFIMTPTEGTPYELSSDKDGEPSSASLLEIMESSTLNYDDPATKLELDLIYRSLLEETDE